jgi:hypothetical protein
VPDAPLLTRSHQYAGRRAQCAMPIRLWAVALMPGPLARIAPAGADAGGTGRQCGSVVEVGAPLVPLPTMALLPREMILPPVTPTPVPLPVIVVPEI